MKNTDNIIKVEIWNKETKHTSGAGRAIVGGIIAGGTGAIVGAATKKDKELVTFKVTYRNGRVEFIDTVAGSIEYRVWIQEMERIDGGLNPMSKGNKTALKALLIIVCLLMLAIILPFLFS